MDLLGGDEGRLGGMGHGREFPSAADPDVAVPVRQRAVENRDIGPDRRQQDDRPVAVAQGIVDHMPIIPPRHQVRADQTAEGHERHPLLGRLEGRMDGRASRIPHADVANLDGTDETWRRPDFAQTDGGGLDALDATGTDQNVDTHTPHRDHQKAEVAGPPDDEGADRGHGDEAVFRRQCDEGAVGNAFRQAIEAFLHDLHGYADL